MNKTDNSWNLVITPKCKWLDIDFKELWRFRDLYLIYIKRDLIAAYKQTILGPLWYIIQPLFTMVIYMFIFGDIAGLSTDGVPQPLFYFSGIMLWNYFLSSFNISAATLRANVSIYSKVYFPRLIIPMAAITGNLVKFGIQLGMFVILYIWWILHGAQVVPNWTLLLLPLIIVMLALHAFSWGLIVSCISYKYHDLLEVFTLIMPLFMYICPVVYPLSATPEKIRPLLELNPLTSIFEIFRYGTTNSGTFEWWDLLYSFIFLLIITTISLLFFNKTERTFMDAV